MKISKSKQELARIISENGGWRDGAESAVQCKSDNAVSFYRDIPNRDGDCWWGEYLDGCDIGQDRLIANWHQSCLSRAEYFYLYPAPDADGCIEWKGGECPVERGTLVDVEYANGVTNIGVSALTDETQSGHVSGSAGGLLATNWGAGLPMYGITAYRLHKPQKSKPEFCESVMRPISEPIAKPTIEQLAADYRNAKDYAERKQQEADAAKVEADAKLAALVATGKEFGLVLSVTGAELEPELIITDWRDLQVGDIIQCVGSWEKEKTDGMQLPVTALEGPHYNGDLPIRVKVPGISCPATWGINFKFIRRP